MLAQMCYSYAEGQGESGTILDAGTIIKFRGNITRIGNAHVW